MEKLEFQFITCDKRGEIPVESGILTIEDDSTWQAELINFTGGMELFSDQGNEFRIKDNSLVEYEGKGKASKTSDEEAEGNIIIKGQGKISKY